MNNRKRQFNWGSLIGPLIFILIIAGGPLLRTINQLLGGTVMLPSNLLPITVSGLVLLSILIPAIRAATNNRQGDSQLPTGPITPSRPSTSAPMPPFGNGTSLPLPPQTRLPQGNTPIPSPPRFEPIVSPAVLVLGLVGIVLLVGVGFVVLTQNIP